MRGETNTIGLIVMILVVLVVGISVIFVSTSRFIDVNEIFGGQIDEANCIDLRNQCQVSKARAEGCDWATGPNPRGKCPSGASPTGPGAGPGGPGTGPGTNVPQKAGSGQDSSGNTFSIKFTQESESSNDYNLAAQATLDSGNNPGSYDVRYEVKDGSDFVELESSAVTTGQNSYSCSFSSQGDTCNAYPGISFVDHITVDGSHSQIPAEPVFRAVLVDSNGETVTYAEASFQSGSTSTSASKSSSQSLCGDSCSGSYSGFDCQVFGVC